MYPVTCTLAVSLGDDTIILNIVIPYFFSITISRTFSSYRDIGKSQFKNISRLKNNRINESIQNFHGKKIKPVFSSFQK